MLCIRGYIGEEMKEKAYSLNGILDSSQVEFQIALFPKGDQVKLMHLNILISNRCSCLEVSPDST